MFKKEEKLQKEKKISKRDYSFMIRKIGVFMTRYFDALVAVFVIIIFLLGIFLVINPKYQGMSKTEEYSQEDLETERNNLKDYVKKLNEYKETYQKLSDTSIGRIKKIVPEDDYLENFFARIENITKKEGVVVKSITIADLDSSDKNEKDKNKSSSVSKKEVVGKIQINLSVDGVDYRGVKRLLEEFENNLRLLDVTDLKFDLVAKTADFTIITYYLNK